MVGTGEPVVAVGTAALAQVMKVSMVKVTWSAVVVFTGTT
jgi:hypothetical protein